MRVALSFPEAGAADVLDLYRWLRDDPEIRRAARPGLARAGGGAPAGAVDVVTLALGPEFAPAHLGAAYAAWRAARPAAPPLTAELDGRRVTVRGGSRGEVARLVRLVGADGARATSAPVPGAAAAQAGPPAPGGGRRPRREAGPDPQAS